MVALVGAAISTGGRVAELEDRLYRRDGGWHMMRENDPAITEVEPEHRRRRGRN